MIAPTEKSCKQCAFRPECLFDRKDRGGFKDVGPEYIGYRLICDRVEDNGAKEDTTTCHNFIESGLQERMLTGREMRERGKDGEHVRIVAMREGLPGWNGRTSVKRRTNVGVNTQGEIVRPNAEIVPLLKKAGYKIATGDASVPVNRREVEYEQPVQNYADELSKITGYQQNLLADESKYSDDVEAAEEAAFEALMAQRKTEKTEVMKATRA